MISVRILDLSFENCSKEETLFLGFMSVLIFYHFFVEKKIRFEFNLLFRQAVTERYNLRGNKIIKPLNGLIFPYRHVLNPPY